MAGHETGAHHAPAGDSDGGGGGNIFEKAVGAFIGAASETVIELVAKPGPEVVVGGVANGGEAIITGTISAGSQPNSGGSAKKASSGH